MTSTDESQSNIQYETTVFTLKPDHLGPNIATLLHAKTTKRTDIYMAVLYIHGFNDYFFHDHVCAEFLKRGYDFFAIDLRKCGRSIMLPHHQGYRHYCRDMREYDEEISLSFEHMLKQAESYSKKKFALLGHSTGGLTTSLYAISGTHRGVIDALILNSPNLVEIDMSSFERLLVYGLIKTGLTVEKVAGWNGKSLHVSQKGEWNFDTTKKPIDKVLVHGPFFRACREAQAEVKRNGHTIRCPILFMSSDRSLKGDKTWRDEYYGADMVLNVQNIRAAAGALGEQVTICSIENATHDIFLSKKPVRDKAFDCMFKWLENLEQRWKNDM